MKVTNRTMRKTDSSILDKFKADEEVSNQVFKNGHLFRRIAGRFTPKLGAGFGRSSHRSVRDGYIGGQDTEFQGVSIAVTRGSAS